MISGFWGTKRRDSANTTDVTSPSLEDVKIHDPHYVGSTTSHKRGKLAEMVEEAEKHEAIKKKEQRECEARISESGSTATARAEEEQVEEIPEQTVQSIERIPDPSGAYESPVKTTINENDGIIDIDVPLPDYLVFETAVSSPSSSGYLSTPGFGNGMEGFEHYSRPGPDGDTPINVGGWLQRYHPDFALQAVPVQEGLTEEIKASMRAEPTPILTSTPHGNNGHSDRWVDISSAVIADTINFSIKRIRYRRLIKLKDIAEQPTPSVSNSLGIDSRYGNPYSATQPTPLADVYNTHIEERFIEEPVISMDETLIEAVERIIAQSGQVSKTNSVCSSQSTSRKGGARERSDSDTKPTTATVPTETLEVPRNECKKMVLSALEEIVRSVAESRKEGGEVEAEEKTESFLREGIRSWLVNVETME
jgi:hypothetical protein